MSDPISDMLTCIRNANHALLDEIKFPHSRLKESIAKILKREGYLSDVNVEGNKIKTIKIRLKFQGRKGVITGLRRVSSPGLRRYVGATEIPRVLGGLGVSILSTPKGVVTGQEAKKLNVGGEVLCYIW